MQKRHESLQKTQEEWDKARTSRAGHTKVSDCITTTAHRTLSSPHVHPSSAVLYCCQSMTSVRQRILIWVDLAEVTPTPPTKRWKLATTT